MSFVQPLRFVTLEPLTLSRAAKHSGLARQSVVQFNHEPRIPREKAETKDVQFSLSVSLLSLTSVLTVNCPEKVIDLDRFLMAVILMVNRQQSSQ